MTDKWVQSREQVTFAILAGGASVRMGKDKAALPFIGEALIQRIVFRGLVLTDNILVITNHSEAYEFLHVPLARDILDTKGPLVGLYTALSVSKTEYLVLVGCDMPFINPNMLAYQLSILENILLISSYPNMPRALNLCIPYIGEIFAWIKLNQH